jgi:DNA repair protein RecN (Recombination protein N)
MLRALSIRRIVIVDALDLEFGDGLTVLTGETGAGKSILLDSLGLALGERADSGLVQAGADDARVIAEFDVAPDHPARLILADAEVEMEDADAPILVRRTLGRDGRSRAFVNDQPVTAGLLRRLGDVLAEVHGQFEQHGLLNPARHRLILDEAGSLEARVAKTTRLWGALRAATETLEADRKAAEDARRDEEFLRHAVAELEKLAPDQDEENALADRRAFLMSRSRLGEALKTAISAIDRSDAAGAIRKGERSLARVAEAAEGRFDHALQALERAGIELDEAQTALSAACDSLDANPVELETVEERLFELRDVARKHNVAPTGLADLQAKLTADLDAIEQSDSRLAELEATAKAAREAYVAAAEALSDERTKAARKLEKAAMAELPPLKLEQAALGVDVARVEEGEWGPSGMDRVRFQARANPGQPFGPLHKVASGGELARFALALRVVLAAKGAAGTLVFDEVDSGIGGATAAAVGERLNRLSNGVQVLVVTHSPQVAALGARHFRVEKGEHAGRVTTGTRRLEGDARQEEIARMLSGAEVTEEARAQAARLMLEV